MQSIGPYALTGEIARGGMGVVYRAKDPILDRDVAIKLMLDGGARAREERFLREAKALAKLRHPHIVAIHQAGLHQEHLYLVMDLVEGESLQSLIERVGPLDQDYAAELCAKVARALAYAHQKGILHRDIKPDNVLISREGEPLLTDLGLAMEVGTPLDSKRLSKSGAMMGTPGYWPPEQARGDLGEIGPSSDIYALGATLFACLTGEPPIQGRDVAEMMIATQDIPARPPSDSREGVDPALDRVVLRCLEKDPQDRYGTAEELALDLERYGRGELTVGIPPLILGGGALVGLLALVLVVLLATREPEPKPVTAAPEKTPTPVTKTEPPPPRKTAPPPPRKTAPPPPRKTRPPPPRRKVSAKDKRKARNLMARGMFKLSGPPQYRDAAFKDIDKAVRIDPYSADLRLKRGVALRVSGKLDEAAAELEQARQLDPDLAKVYLELAVIAGRQGRHQEALEQVDRCLRLDANMGVAHLLRGDALTELGRHSPAVDAYQQALRLVNKKKRPTTYKLAADGLARAKKRAGLE